MKKNLLNGFTLVEMSIVLVIIGIVTGGIIVAQSMMANARLQTVITDVNNYITVAGNFKQAYKNLPGDFSSATTSWGTDSNGCPAGGGATGTCNGNADGEIINSNTAGQAQESFLFWQHLYMAGMFSQTLSNQSGSTSAYDAVIGTNSPAGSIKSSLFMPVWLGTNGGTQCSTSDCFPGFYGNVFIFGGRNITTRSIPITPVLTPTQAAAIDSKTDDGLPASGNVLALQSGSTLNPNCTTTSVASTALYNVGTNSQAPLCGLIFLMGF